MSFYYQSPKFSVDTKADYEELHDFDPLEIAGHETDYQFNRLDSTPDFRRWSVIDKVKTHYGHYKVKDASECGKFVTRRCFLGILMLVVFISLTVLFFKVILFNFTLGPIEYDFIIVGGGPAGCIIAQTLSNAGAKVLLLEAGSSPQIDIEAVAASTSIKKFSPTNSVNINKYNLLNSLNLLETPFLWYSAGDFPDILWEEEGPTTNYDPVLAKGLGGNSLLSAMIYLRALPEDILKWDLSSITWERLFETYRTQEKYISISNSGGSSSNRTSDSNNTISSSYHGNSGFFGTTDNNNYRDPVSEAFLDSAIHSGLFSLNQDFNNPLTSRINTIGYYDFNIWDGLRSTVVQQLFQQSEPTKSSSSATTTSIDGLHSNKLTIQLNAKVKKVLLSTLEDIPEGDEERHRAYGVLYELDDGKQHRATLATNTRSLSSLSPGMRTSQPIPWKRNVILTAGAVMTPHLLRESGIGSCNDGETMKICNDMIGTNIQDHPSVYMIMELKNRISSGDFISFSKYFFLLLVIFYCRRYSIGL
jgi:choline dehydrogenase-like flavoprotein